MKSIKRKAISVSQFLRLAFVKLHHRYRSVPLQRAGEDEIALASEGFLYIAFGAGYTQEAMVSIKSLRRFHGQPICLMTDRTDLADRTLIDRVEFISPEHLRAKVDYIDMSPFQRTIYLDSDTFVNDSLQDLFKLLCRYQMVGVIDTARKRKYLSRRIRDYSEIPYGFAEINTGVLGFSSCPEVTHLFKSWRDIFYRYYIQTGGWDQPSFRIALWKSQVRFHTLPAEFNVRSKSNIEKIKNIKGRLGSDHMTPRIYHLHCSPDVKTGCYCFADLETHESQVRELAVSITY